MEVKPKTVTTKCYIQPMLGTYNRLNMGNRMGTLLDQKHCSTRRHAGIMNTIWGICFRNRYGMSLVVSADRKRSEQMQWQDRHISEWETETIHHPHGSKAIQSNHPDIRNRISSTHKWYVHWDNEICWIMVVGWSTSHPGWDANLEHEWFNANSTVTTTPFCRTANSMGPEGLTPDHCRTSLSTSSHAFSNWTSLSEIWPKAAMGQHLLCSAISNADRPHCVFHIQRHLPWLSSSASSSTPPSYPSTSSWSDYHHHHHHHHHH